MRAGENPSVAEAGVEGARVFRAAGDGVAAARPDLDFVATSFGSRLREARRRCKQQDPEEEQGRAHDDLVSKTAEPRVKTHDTGRDALRQTAVAARRAEKQVLRFARNDRINWE